MKVFNSHNPIEKVEFLINKLINFSNENQFDFLLYKSFADQSGKVFNRYFGQIESETEKQKIISNLKADVYFIVDKMVTDQICKPGTKVKDYESNYKQLIELFFNSVEFEKENKLEQNDSIAINQSHNKRITAFKKVVNDIEILTNTTNASFNKFYTSREFSKFEYLENFVDELNDSFLRNVNRNHTLKFYLSELAFWNKYFNVDNHDLIFNTNSNDKDLGISEKGILEANYIFEIILNEITLCCSLYDVDFYNICDEINFDYSCIDTGLIGVFDKKINDKNKQEINDPFLSSQNSFIDKKDIFKKRNSLIPDVEIEQVFNFFNVLATSTNKNGEFYLSEEKLLLFIKSTFIDKKQIPIDFDVQFSKDRQSVRSVFKKFEIECVKFEKNQKHLKQKYSKIMLKSFNIFNENDLKKWHVTDNKIPTIKIERLNKHI